MKNAIAVVIAFCSFFQVLLAQDNLIRPSAIGVSFILNDFTTAQRIRSGSLETVLRDKKWADIKEMSPGLGISYFKGLHRNIDLAANVGFSFVNYPLPNKAPSAEDALLIEMDATANFKMFPENYWVSPYLIAGLGASQYKAKYGAYLPLGAGIKVNFFDEAALFINTTYRVAVTPENTNYHFTYALGVAGVIGKKKSP